MQYYILKTRNVYVFSAMKRFQNSIPLSPYKYGYFVIQAFHIIYNSAQKTLFLQNELIKLSA